MENVGTLMYRRFLIMLLPRLTREMNIPLHPLPLNGVLIRPLTGVLIVKLRPRVAILIPLAARLPIGRPTLWRLNPSPQALKLSVWLSSRPLK